MKRKTKITFKRVDVYIVKGVHDMWGSIDFRTVN